MAGLLYNKSYNIFYAEVEVSSEAKNIKSIPAIKPTELKNETRENENENRGSNKLQQKSSNKGNPSMTVFIPDQVFWYYCTIA